MLVFKNRDLSEQFELVDERLRHIVLALMGFIDYHFGKDLVITSIFRDQDGSVHKYWRGVDFRITPQGGEAIYTDNEINLIKDFCSSYIYDRNKARLKTLLTHDAGSGLHGHLQVSSKLMTELIEGA